MTYHTSPLDHVRVAAPCSAGWDRMLGDDRVRFCAQCSLNVYNLSDMSKREAESLIMRTEGRLCVRYYRRADGSILTNNCPVGLRALKRRASRIANATVSTVLGFLAGLGLYSGFSREDEYAMMGSPILVEQPLSFTPETTIDEEEVGLEPTLGRYAPEVNLVAGEIVRPVRTDEGEWVDGELEKIADNEVQPVQRQRGVVKKRR